MIEVTRLDLSKDPHYCDAPACIGTQSYLLLTADDDQGLDGWLMTAPDHHCADFEPSDN
jgi:hypothetical protein